MYETFLFESKVSITECLPSICRKAFYFWNILTINTFGINYVKNCITKSVQKKNYHRCNY